MRFRVSVCARAAPNCAEAASRPTGPRTFATAAILPRRPIGTINFAPTPAASPAEIDRKSKAMEEIMSVLNTEERKQLRSLLDRLLQKLNEYSEE